MVHASQDWTRHKARRVCGWRTLGAGDWLHGDACDALVRPSFVVVGDELGHGAPKLPLREEDEVVRALTAEGADEPLHDPVLCQTTIDPIPSMSSG